MVEGDLLFSNIILSKLANRDDLHHIMDFPLFCIYNIDRIIHKNEQNIPCIHNVVPVLLHLHWNL
jgi:hypothetical protein